MELYRFVKASEVPKETDMYVCLCETNINGVKTHRVTWGKWSSGYSQIFVDENLYGKVIEWLEPLPESEQDELWDDVMQLIGLINHYQEMVKEFPESAFKQDLEKSLKELSNSYHLIKK